LLKALLESQLGLIELRYLPIRNPGLCQLLLIQIDGVAHFNLKRLNVGQTAVMLGDVAAVEDFVAYHPKADLGKSIVHRVDEEIRAAFAIGIAQTDVIGDGAIETVQVKQIDFAKSLN
jgi:hypothetical protein